MPTFRVVDLRSDDSEGTVVSAAGPHQAAEAVLGLKLVRGGHSRQLLAKVYSAKDGQPVSMIRFYASKGTEKTAECPAPANSDR